MAKIICNLLTGNIIAPDNRCVTNFNPIKRVRDYNIKSNKSRSKLRLKALYLLKHFKGYHSFITLTTQQHYPENGETFSDSVVTFYKLPIERISDKKLFHYVGVFLRNKKFFGDHYICVAERQRGTNDLHFHILTYFQKKEFVNYSDMRQCWASIIGADNHPALLQYDWVDRNDKNEVTNYISKLSAYCSKSSGESSNAYMSMFKCRTYSVSNKLSLSWKQNADIYTKIVDEQFLLINKDKLLVKYTSDYFVIYKLTPDIWELAKIYAEARALTNRVNFYLETGTG